MIVIRGKFTYNKETVKQREIRIKKQELFFGENRDLYKGGTIYAMYNHFNRKKSIL